MPATQGKYGLWYCSLQPDKLMAVGDEYKRKFMLICDDCDDRCDYCSNKAIVCNIIDYRARKLCKEHMLTWPRVIGIANSYQVTQNVSTMGLAQNPEK